MGVLQDNRTGEKIVTRKFAQNPDLRKKLLDTGNYTLYEATSNQFSGCGLRLNSRLWTSGMISGKNHMGHILMRVREKMRDSYTNRPSTVTSATYTDDGYADIKSRSALNTITSIQDSTLIEEAATAEPMEVGPKQIPTAVSTVISNADQARIHESIMGTQELIESSDNTSSVSEENSSFRDFATNSEFDICKVNAWKLPRVKRGTKDWADKEKARGLLKRRRSDRHSTPNHNSPPHSDPPHRKRITRYFRNSRYQEKLMKEHGYDTETRYQKVMASYNKSHVTDQRVRKNEMKN